MNNLRREYSNISLTNVFEINAPRGQYGSLLTINIREAERESTKRRVTHEVADLVGAIPSDLKSHRTLVG